MRLIISGKKVQVTEAIKEVLTEKLARLEKYFKEDVEVHATIGIEKDRQKIEITIPMKGHIIRAEEVSDDMYVSIDLVIDVIERQIRKYKTKLLKRNKNQPLEGYNPNFFEDVDVENEEEIKIVKSKKFGFRPMSPEEACLQMELLRHSFFVFVNGQTEEVNVVYKRKDGTYGIIEPEF